MKTIFKKIDKQLVSSMPRAFFEGKITVIDKPEDVEAAIDYLLSFSLLGVDTETRPSFRKGVHNEVCLLQVSTYDECFLFRLHLTGMHPAIIRFLSDKKVPKIGLSWHDDLKMLHQKAVFEPGLFYDIQDISQEFGLLDLSLQKLFANLFHKKISKAQRLSNWEAKKLRDSQKVYAATDAWACLLLYDEFVNLRRSKDYELIEPEPEPAQKSQPEMTTEPNPNSVMSEEGTGTDGEIVAPDTDDVSADKGESACI